MIIIKDSDVKTLKKYHNGSFYLTKPEILTIAKNRLEKLDPYDANYTMFQLDELSDLKF